MRDQAPQASPSEAPATRQKWIVCRVCLQQPKEPMACIFNDESTKDMTQMIMECGGVPVSVALIYPDSLIHSFVLSDKKVRSLSGQDM